MNSIAPLALSLNMNMNGRFKTISSWYAGADVAIIIAVTAAASVPFVPRCSFTLVYVCLSHLGTSTSPTALLIGLRGHGWLLSPTARGSHLRLARLGSERCSHHLGEHRKIGEIRAYKPNP